MPRKSGQVVGRPVIAKIVEQQKRICLGRFPKAKGTTQPYAGALDGWLGLHNAFDRTDGHECDDLLWHGSPRRTATLYGTSYRAFVHEQKILSAKNIHHSDDRPMTSS